jgi:CBS domain-containing protein
MFLAQRIIRNCSVNPVRKFPSSLNINVRTMSSDQNSVMSIYEKSCYKNVDFKIDENAPVREAVDRFTVFNISCLAVTDKTSKVIGVCSGRDFIHKVAAVNKNPDEVKVKDIATFGDKIIVAKKTDNIETCMNKMLFKNIRHLLIVDDKDAFVGLISIKDIVKQIMDKNKRIITRLSDFSLGKGAYYGSE